MTRKNLLFFRNGNFSQATNEFEAIQNAEEQRTMSYKPFVGGFFSTKAIIGPIIVSTLLSLFQQFSGVYVLLFYTSHFTKMVSFDKVDIGNLIIYLMGFLGSTIFPLMIHKVGLKIMFVVGFFGMSVSLFSIYAVTYAFNVALLNIFLIGSFLFWFQAGPCLTIWIIFKKVFLQKYQQTSQTYLSFIFWVFNYLIISLFPSVLSAFGINLILIIAILNAIFAVFVCIFFVDQKEKTKETIIIEYQQKFPFSK
ncbi:hypothetical protein MXB_5393 [Myxobolus squamalis]|nr:hypothetical protein MXB_5393 [Myxobolus squamalis]